jgi:hypothetical protein
MKEHTINTTLTQLLSNKDRTSVCEVCGNDVESWKLKDIYTSWGHKQDLPSRRAYRLIANCPA